jgi:hypothetical protein
MTYQVKNKIGYKRYPKPFNISLWVIIVLFQQLASMTNCEPSKYIHASSPVPK